MGRGVGVTALLSAGGVLGSVTDLAALLIMIVLVLTSAGLAAYWLWVLR